MAQQQARDEAGNIWYVDDAGNPVGLAQAAPQGGGSVVAPNPVQAQRQSVDLGGAQLGNQKTAQQIALDAVKLQTAPQMSAEELRAQQLANQKAERDLAAPVEAKQTITDRLSRLRQLAGQVGRTQSLYDSGIGQTKGIKGVLDYLPTDANSRFDVAGGQLSQQGLAAFRQPGSGTVSDRDAAMFDRANLPTSGTRDAAVEEQLRSIRSRVDEEMKALGQQPVNWTAITQQQSDQPQQDRNAPMIAASGGGGSGNPPPPTGPAGYDVAGVAGGVSGGPGGAGSTFADAAGVAMATKLKQAYNQGAGVQQLNQLLTENGYQPFADPQAIEAINKRGPLNFAPPEMADTRSGFGNALGNAVAGGGIGGDVGAYAAQATNALTGNNLDSIAGGSTGLALDYAQQKSPTASLLGTMAGSTAAAAGAELGLGAAAARAGIGATPWVARGADALYGAISGAGDADGPGESRVLGAALGGGLGLGGGIAGRAAARGVGGALTGIQNTDVRALREAGVPTTVGQTLGGTARRVENSLMSVPGVGDIIGNRYREGISALRPAAVRQAVDGVPNNITATSGREAIEQGRTAVGNAYDSALGGVNLTIDPMYRRELGAALQGANTLPGPLRDTFASTLQNRVAPQFRGQQIDGRGLQAAVQGLRKDSGALISRNEVQSDLFADRATDIEESLFNLAERQAPGTPTALQAANRANRGLSIVEEASARAMNNGGDFTAAQLGQSIRQNARRFNGMKALNSGKAPLQALQEAAQNVLPSVVPDSGTTGRAIVAGGLGALGLGGAGAGTGYAAGGGEGAGLGTGLGLSGAALLALGGTKAGQKALTAALLNRTTADQIVGRAIKNRAGLGGIFGAPMLAGGGAYLAGQ